MIQLQYLADALIPNDVYQCVSNPVLHTSKAKLKSTLNKLHTLANPINQ